LSQTGCDALEGGPVDPAARPAWAAGGPLGSRGCPARRGGTGEGPWGCRRGGGSVAPPPQSFLAYDAEAKAYTYTRALLAAAPISG